MNAEKDTVIFNEKNLSKYSVSCEVLVIYCSLDSRSVPQRAFETY